MSNWTLMWTFRIYWGWGTEETWEIFKKSHCYLCFHDSTLYFSSIFCSFISFPTFYHSFPIYYHQLPQCHSSHLPVTVDVGGCHRVAKVGPHLERITNKTQSACNHTTVHRSLFFSFIFSLHVLFPFLYPQPPPPEAFLFNLSIPQFPGVSSSPFSWRSVLKLL